MLFNNFKTSRNPDLFKTGFLWNFEFTFPAQLDWLNLEHEKALKFWRAAEIPLHCETNRIGLFENVPNLSIRYYSVM